ncbi:MAG: PocR ligand-binding domain-containing protein [Candidatus Omnitrophota bacterium]
MEFQKIIDLRHWQNIQDLFSSAIQISLRTIDKYGGIVVSPSNMPQICTQVISTSSAAKKKCWRWFPQVANQFKNPMPDAAFRENICPLGLFNITLPLNFNGVKDTCLIVGPLIKEEKREELISALSTDELGIDRQQFFESFNKLPVVNSDDLDWIIGSIQSIALFVAKLFVFEREHGDEDFLKNKEAIANLLKIFLELATKLCKAEFGSVLVFEKSTQELSIKEAKGLSQEVVENTKIKPGEGIAGLTIARRKAMFISDGLRDRDIRLRMHKPKTKSAFVIPVFSRQEVLGVICVATAKSPNNFSDKLMALLNELVGIALEKVTLE